MPVTAVARDALVGQVIEDFASRFARGGVVHYVSDKDWAYQNPELIADLGLTPKMRRRMPDVLIYQDDIKRLILIDVSTGQGVMTQTRRDELVRMYFGSRLDLVFVTAFPNLDAVSISSEYIAWETEVWVADAPDHLTHFNGDKFLGPY